MATAKKKESVESKVETTEETPQEEIQQDAISDRKIILAPLAKYGVFAVIIVGIIVTTAIMMNREFNEIDAQVAALEIEIAQQNQPTPQTEQEVTKTTEQTEQAAVEPVEVIASNDKAIPVTTLAEVIQPVATAPVVSAAVSAPAQPASRTDDAKTRIAKFHEFMAQQDQKQLDTYKLNQAKQIEMLRAQLTRQQERIEAIEKRNQESYALREAAVKNMQKARKQSLNRI